MSPQLSIGGATTKTRRSYTDPLRQPLCEPLDDLVLGTAVREADRVRDRATAARAVGDHDEPAQAEEVGAAVSVGVELLPETPGGRPNQRATELARRRRRDLLPQGVEQL